MGYWLSLIFVVILFATMGQNISAGRKDEGKLIKVLFTIVLIYFSAFRISLGTDYPGYLERIDFVAIQSVDFTILSEPTFWILAEIVNKTKWLTPIFLFLVMAIVTMFGIMSFLSRRENLFWSASIIIFSLLPILYFNSFNLVRQFAATGFFFLSLNYVISREPWKYAACIFFAYLFHTSSIILVTLYFVLKNQYNVKNSILFVLITAVVAIYYEQVITNVSFLSNRFSVYLDTSETMSTSGMIILYNIIGVILLLKRKRFSSEYDNVAINCMFLLIIFSDLSMINFFFFRIAVYFSPVFAYILPRVISEFSNRKTATVVSFCFVMILLIPFLFNNLYNPLIIPDGIYSIRALFDESLFKYKY